MMTRNEPICMATLRTVAYNMQKKNGLDELEFFVDLSSLETRSRFAKNAQRHLKKHKNNKCTVKHILKAIDTLEESYWSSP